MSWFQLTALYNPIGPSAAWRHLYIRLHNMYYLFIAIISLISKYKAFNIISFFNIYINT